MLARPVIKGMCKYESLLDGTIDLEHIAEMNEWLDVQEENERRWHKANNKNG